MQVYPETNTVYCFSSNCKLHGKAIDQIDFIMHKESCTKHEAILKAKELLNYSTNQKVMNQDENLSKIFKQQRKSLHRTKKALQYLKDRNLDPMKSEIGFNSYQSGYKQLQNCITFALKNKIGNITSLYGRSIADKKGNNHYYLKNRKGLYPSYPNQETKTIIITEAIIDAATLLTHTDYTVLSLYGTNGWNEEHSEAIRNLTSLEEIIFFMDGDEAGNKAIETYAPLVKAMKPSIKISKVETHENEDINSLVISHEPEILTHLINERTFLFSSETASQRVEEEPQQSQSLELNTENPEYIFTEVGELRFTIMGGIGLYPLDKMKVTVKI